MKVWKTVLYHLTFLSYLTAGTWADDGLRIEIAGIPMEKLPGSMTSVYCGCFTGDYGDLANADIYDAAPYQATGKGKAMLSNRVSWFFDLRASSFTVDTACSSSLYALHLACQSLRLKESNMVR